jgi:outer membrane murein-binding lipoprotein Lpp
MKRITAALAALVIASLALAGCSAGEYQERKDKQSTTTLDNSLGMKNQKDRLEREEDPNQIRYVYLLAKLDGNVLGYYTISGKVSPAGTQLAPEQEIVRYYGEGYVVDSAKDDNTYGASDSGSFFFTTEDVLIETTLDYIQSDAPIAFYGDTPRLNEGSD